MYTHDYIKNEKARNDIIDLFRNHLKSENNITLDYFRLPNLLYRYSHLNKYVLKNLKENTFSSTIPTEFNDLYDSTMHFNTTIEYQNNINELNQSAQSIGYGEVIDNKLKESLYKQARELDSFKLSYLTNDFRIVCFTTKYKDIKMWSHYGNNNKGICIAYDLSKDEILNYAYPVIYIDKPIDMTELCKDEDKLSLAVLISVISKFNDWKEEKEWRIVFYLYNFKEKRVPLINIPKPECIYLGNRFVSNYAHARKNNKEESKIIEEFLDYINDTRIDLKIAEPQIRSYDLEYKDITVKEIKKKLH